MRGTVPMRVRDLLPASLVGYRLEYLRFDLAAGLAVAAVAIPSAIAYPAIAGLPAEVGLYASILPLVGYALFGPSRKLMVGPDAATMTVLAAALATMPLDNPADRVAAAAALARGRARLLRDLGHMGVRDSEMIGFRRRHRGRGRRANCADDDRGKHITHTVTPFRQGFST